MGATKACGCSRGLAIPQNYAEAMQGCAEAVKWYRLAADQGWVKRVA
jgi:hypothetical protein